MTHLCRHSGYLPTVWPYGILCLLCLSAQARLALTNWPQKLSVRLLALAHHIRRVSPRRPPRRKTLLPLPSVDWEGRRAAQLGQKISHLSAEKKLLNGLLAFGTGRSPNHRGMPSSLSARSKPHDTGGPENTLCGRIPAINHAR